MNGCFNSLAFLSMQELLVVLLIAILIFGAAKIPQIARALGKSIREFKKGASEDLDEPANGKTDASARKDSKDSNDKPQP